MTDARGDPRQGEAGSSIVAIPGSASKMFWDYYRENPKEIAVIEAGCRAWSRQEVGAASVFIRDRLALRGISEGDAVAVVAPNCAEFLAAYLGITLLGANAVPVNYHLIDDEIAHVLRVSCASAIVVHSGMSERLSQTLNLLGMDTQMLVLPDQLVDEISRSDPFMDQPRSIALPENLGRTILFTSATTGKPKAVKFRKNFGFASLARNIAFREFQGIRRNSGAVHYCASPMYHAGPLEGAIVTLHMGNSVVITRRWDVREALRAIANYRVTSMYVVPVMVVQLAKIPASERSQYNIESLRMLLHGGAPCPQDAKRSLIEWLGPIVYEGYAASEGGGTFVNSTDWLRFPGTVGKAIPGAEIVIRSQSGEELSRGESGLVYIRSYTGDRFEYLGDPEATNRCYIGDQFTVGDIGYLNDEGFLFLLDRAVNVIICAGSNVYPAEIEAVIVSHPLVSDCAVIGIPDDDIGERVHAVVQPLPEVGLPESKMRAEIVRYLYRRLSPGKLPRTIEFVKSIPRDPNGKLLKRKLMVTRAD